jgi:SpoIIAA-like
MIEHTLDTTNAILYIRPQSSLEKADFEKLAREVDPFIEGTGNLAGLVIETPGFPGWSSFGAFAAHLRFVRDHHKHIKKIALVTDSAVGNIAEHLVSHFVSAEIKQFPASAADSARQWIVEQA